MRTCPSMWLPDCRNQKTKDNDGEDGKLDFSLQGVLQHGHALHLFGLYPWISKDANYWWTSVVRALQVHEGSFDFERVHLQVDGGSENWNKISFLLGPVLLEHYPRLRSVRFSRMLVGHTHNDLDQKFSVPYEATQGRKGAGGFGRTILGHTEWLKMLAGVFAAAAATRKEKVKKTTKKRKRRSLGKDPTAAVKAAYEEDKEPMKYEAQRHNFDVKGLLEPLVSKYFGGYGPIRDRELKAAGHQSIHVMEFYKERDEDIKWRYKTNMHDKEWQHGGDVYDTILVGKHKDGDLAGRSARDVIKGLGSGSIVPPILEQNGWFVTDCSCGCEDPKCCTCDCGYVKFKREVAIKIDACVHLSEAERQTAKDDWQAHFNQWDNHEQFLEQDQPRWGLPSPSPPPAEDDGDAKRR